MFITDENYTLWYNQYNDTANFTEEVSSTFSEPANSTIPSFPKGNQRSMPVLVLYCLLFFVAAIGNLTVFISLFRSRHRKSRISLMIRHLTIADLIVTFVMIPVEVGWRLTVEWIAGNFACKAFHFLRAFGLYLSSNILVCVSLDRYFAVLYPLRVNDARRRGKFMLLWAWGISAVCALPQIFIFHIALHPYIPNFEQCVTFDVFNSDFQQIIYNIFGLLVMYFVPLIVISVAYSAIMWKISKKSRDSREENQPPAGRMRLRRSDISNIERARSRTLRMTITIVLVFVICWTPYVIMTLWYTFDPDSASEVSYWIQDALFMMAVANSVMNPIVYGSYTIDLKKDCKYLWCCKSKNNGIGGSNITRSTALAHGVNNNRRPVNPPRQEGPLILMNNRNMTRATSSVPLYEPVNHIHHSFSSDPCQSNSNVISNNLAVSAPPGHEMPPLSPKCSASPQSASGLTRTSTKRIINRIRGLKFSQRIIAGQRPNSYAFTKTHL